MPRSRATCAIGRPDSNTNRTARSRNSSSYLRGRDIDRSSTSSRTDHPGFEASAEPSLAQSGLEREALTTGKLLLEHPRAPLGAERVGGRVAPLEVAVQHRRDLVLDLGAPLDQPAP